MTCIATIPNTAPVLEFRCLYTADLRRKQKRWQDGRIKYHTFNRRVMLYDEQWNFIGDTHWRELEDLREGDEVSLERTIMLVQVSESVGSTDQDLSEIFDRRHTKRPKQSKFALRLGPAHVQVDRTDSGQSSIAVGSHAEPKSIRNVLGSIPDHEGGACPAARSYPNQGRELAVGSKGTERWRETDGSPYRKISYANSLTGASLVLQSQPTFNRAPKSNVPIGSGNHASSSTTLNGAREHQTDDIDVRVSTTQAPCVSDVTMERDLLHQHHCPKDKASPAKLPEDDARSGGLLSTVTSLSTQGAHVEARLSLLDLSKRSRSRGGAGHAGDARHVRQRARGTTGTVGNMNESVAEHIDVFGESQHEINIPRLNNEDLFEQHARHSRLMSCRADAEASRQSSGLESRHHRYSSASKTQSRKLALRIVSKPRRPRLVSLLKSANLSSRTEDTAVSRHPQSRMPSASESGCGEPQQSALSLTSKRINPTIEQVGPLDTDDVVRRILDSGNNGNQPPTSYQHERRQPNEALAEHSNRRGRHAVSHDNGTELMSGSTTVNRNVTDDLVHNASDDPYQNRTHIEASPDADANAPLMKESVTMVVPAVATSSTSKGCRTPRRASSAYEPENDGVLPPPWGAQVSSLGDRHDSQTGPWTVEADDLFAWKRPNLEDRIGT